MKTFSVKYTNKCYWLQIFILQKKCKIRKKNKLHFIWLAKFCFEYTIQWANSKTLELL